MRHSRLILFITILSVVLGSPCGAQTIEPSGPTIGIEGDISPLSRGLTESWLRAAGYVPMAAGVKGEYRCVVTGRVDYIDPSGVRIGIPLKRLGSAKVDVNKDGTYQAHVNIAIYDSTGRSRWNLSDQTGRAGSGGRYDASVGAYTMNVYGGGGTREEAIKAAFARLPAPPLFQPVVKLPAAEIRYQGDVPGIWITGSAGTAFTILVYKGQEVFSGDYQLNKDGWYYCQNRSFSEPVEVEITSSGKSLGRFPLPAKR